MMSIIPLYLVNLFCAWFECEFGGNAPFVHLDNRNTKALLASAFQAIPPGLKLKDLSIDPKARSFFSDSTDAPVVYTNNGVVQGFRMKIWEDRVISAFTGIPYGEAPTGNLRFRAPVPRKPWNGILKATSPSPCCIQMAVVPLAPMSIKGQEDCLYVDVYTPDIRRNGTNLFPVIMWIPAGANFFGRSRFYGPKYILREDVVFVVINNRLGLQGFLSTGDEFGSGNWGLKDQSLAIKWVHENIREFGGDPDRIIIGGISSAGYAAHSMLYTNYETKNYIKGIISMSASSFLNNGLDVTGRVQKGSDLVAEAAGCPTSASGRSKAMVECLRKVDPYMLVSYQSAIMNHEPIMSLMLGPVVEPDVPGAYITELPEKLYARGEVPAIPLITSRTEDETSLFAMLFRFSMLPKFSMNWKDWMPKFLKLGIRSFNGEPAASQEETIQSLNKITRLYFNRTTPPHFIRKNEFLAFIKLLDDNLINAAMWKGIEYHHKVAPTYGYIIRHYSFTQIHPSLKLVKRIFLNDFQSSHAVEAGLLFNNTLFQPFQPGTDFEIASKNLVNLIFHFAKLGKPLYRSPEGELISVWKPVEDMNQPLVLDVGLVNNISMKRDPLVGTERLKIWDTVKF